MAIYNAAQLVSASNATYTTNGANQITAALVRGLNDDWISSSVLLNQDNTFEGNQTINGDLTVTGSIFGTATSASYAVSASHALNADNAISASHALASDTSISASHALASDTAISASHALASDTSISASHALVADTATTASHVTLADSASFVTEAVVAKTDKNNTFGGIQGFASLTATSITSTGTVSSTAAGVSATITNAFGGYFEVVDTSANNIGLGLATEGYGTSGWTGPALWLNNPSDTYPVVIGFENKSTWTDGRVTFLTPISASQGITGSLTVSSSEQCGIHIITDTVGSGISFEDSTTTNNLQVGVGALGNGLCLRSNGAIDNRITAVGFESTGSFLITGSLTITGSAYGNVESLSIASNTASLDLTRGNFFTLQLVEGADTHINPTGIVAGQTVNLLLSTTGSATVSFPSSVKQVSGSAYVPTTDTSKDILTLVAFDSSDLYLANVKNLI